MYTIQSAYQHLKHALISVYDEHEATAIAHEYIEHLSGLSKLQRLAHKDSILSDEQEDQFTIDTNRLISGVPIQYVIGTAWFMGREYIVNEHVLIPRPETEELVQWIIDDHNGEQAVILDIGTGSGCIPISLKLNLPSTSVTSCDVSKEALAVATENARRLDADINLIEVDFLNPIKRDGLGHFDIIISNPPYIPDAYKADMHSNVKDHEPNLALFVPDNDPLIFYKAIANFGLTHLKPNGSIYCELHADHAKETEALFIDMGYKNVVLKQDMFGKHRMLYASR